MTKYNLLPTQITFLAFLQQIKKNLKYKDLYFIHTKMDYTFNTRYIFVNTSSDTIKQIHEFLLLNNVIH